MRIGCAAYSYRDALKGGTMTLEQFVDLCADMGLDGVELTSYYFPSTDREYLNSLKRHCLRRGMHILATAVGSNFTQADEEKRREHVQMTKDWIDHSVVLGAPCIRIFAGPIPAGETDMDGVNRVLECVRELVPYAAERGVVLALENHGGVAATGQMTLRFVQQIQSPWFGINLDFGNFRTDPYAEFAMLAAHTVTTHAKRTMNCPEGRVPVDYTKVADVMREAEYRGYISIEYEDEEDPATAVPEFANQLKTIFGRSCG